MKKVFICSWMICLFSACAGAISYDGNWWNSVSKGEKTDFLAGYINCAVYDAEQTNMAGVAWNLLEPEITKFYRENTSELKTPVVTVLAQFGSTEKLKPPPGGESYPGKYGMFDGEYWRKSFDDERLGFITGYIACQREFKKPEASFSREVQWYVDQISKWYGIQPDDPSEINTERSLDKIADVLYSLKD